MEAILSWLPFPRSSVDARAPTITLLFQPTGMRKRGRGG
jgi:hypothetical protein